MEETNSQTRVRIIQSIFLFFAGVQFTKTGNPGIERFEWPEYNLDTRATMFVGQDSSISIVNDPKGEQRKKLMPSLDELFPVKKA